MKPEQLLGQYLDKQHMMQLATTAGNQPWICTVYFVVDDARNLYWASLPTRRHSQEIKQNPQVAVAVAVKFTNGEPVVGMQMTGSAQELTPSPDNRPLAAKYAERFGRDEQWIEDFVSGRTEHRFYKLTPSSIYLFDEVNFPGGQRQQIL